MNLYALLIGINEYELSPLNQCVNDVKEFEKYLNTLGNVYNNISIEVLIDHKATKSNIIKHITTFLNKANDDDVAFIYYSGHGTLEDSSGRFSDAYTGLIECLVCYHNDQNNENFLLADKELRYLFSKFENNPHLITVFDCCHSGDIVRSVINQAGNDSRQRKLSTVFPSRKYEDFVFCEEIDEESTKTLQLSSLIPYKNSVNISACLSSESSWEDHKGGVFTRFLLQLLKAKDSKLNYLDIAKWAKISLKDITNKKQTPTISVQGSGKIDHYSSWLNLYPEHNQIDQGQVFYNNKNGWYYNKGQLFGIKEGAKITIQIEESKTFTTEIIDVSLEDSLITDPLEAGIELDFKKSYPVITETVFNALDIHVLNLDKNIHTQNQVTAILTNIDNLNISTPESASFFVIIFNQTVYITLPDDPYRPLAVQIDILNTNEETIQKRLENQIEALVKWNYYNTLINPDAGFSVIPIKVEMRINESQQWIDVTNSGVDLNTIENQYTRSGEYYQKFQIKVSNISNEDIFVSALLLSSDIGISTDLLDNKSKKLKPGETILFYEHRKTPLSYWTLDAYKEIYNWKHDWLYYKFIVNNQEDITPIIPDMAQSPLSPPITHHGNLMGTGAVDDLELENTKWDVYTTELRLHNPTYNILGKKVLQNWDWYSNDEIVAPFINALYTSKKQNGFIFKTINSPNATGDIEVNTRSVSGFKLKLGNYLDDKCRYRKFKKSKKMFPHLPVIVAEGDSWFLFPFLVKDTLDYVMEKYPLRSIAAAGDEIQNYRDSGQLLKEIEKERPRYVLISGGGNDVIGPEIEDILIPGLESGLEASEYLNENHQKKMNQLWGNYNYFFNRISEFDFVEQVFIHGYDYVLADLDDKTIKNGWVNKYLIKKGITVLEDRSKIIRYLIDTFNALLEDVTQKHKNATYLDMRSTVSKNEWYDEIHPNDAGFAKVAEKFLNAINQLEYIDHENM
ncbi:caspase family protein [Aquimarina mytili]|uniref:Caspase family protein n=1 Tax=Aquimarina mytili TaxID=874423 RepID=A0A937D568_9FLAO|nr:caspase family protein [Aquimarina mytili]MBL0682974.1 caspase family protein [Aquimarina mytili]